MQIPYKFATPWASAAVPPYITPIIPVASSGRPEGATQQQGYPPITGTFPSAGGIPPDMGDWNGAMYYATAWLQYLQAGAPIPYDADFANNIGGYPPGAIVNNGLSTNAGVFWLNISGTNNVTNPDDPFSTVGWTQWPFPPPSPTSLRVIGTTGVVPNVTNLTLNATNVTGSGGLATATPIPQLQVGHAFDATQQFLNINFLEFNGATVSSGGAGFAIVNIGQTPLTVNSVAPGPNQSNVTTINFTGPLAPVISGGSGVVNLANQGITVEQTSPGLSLFQNISTIVFNGSCTLTDDGGGAITVTVSGGTAGIPGLGAVGSYMSVLTAVPTSDGNTNIFIHPIPGDLRANLFNEQGYSVFDGTPTDSSGQANTFGVNWVPVGDIYPGTWRCMGPWTCALPGGNQGLCSLGEPAILQPSLDHWYQITTTLWIRIV